jgi:hypothetical protein
MKMNSNKNVLFSRFVSCVRRAGLLMILPQAAGCALAGEPFIISPAGSAFNDGFQPALTKRSQFYTRRNFSRESFAAENSNQ